MGSAKDIVVRPISSSDARDIIRSIHYSGKVDLRSSINLGVFIGDRCGGAMQFGPSIDKGKIMPLVAGTSWSGFIELNRLAFADWLPRNSESRALSIAMRMLRKTYPFIEWVISYSDATQCGDGAIYRASGFVLTAIKKNNSMWRLPSGEVIADIITRMAGATKLRTRIGFNPSETFAAYAKRVGAVKLDGYQLRYVFFLNPAARARLTVPEIPFSRIHEMGARMYKGQRVRSSEATWHHHEDRRGSTDPDAPPPESAS